MCSRRLVSNPGRIPAFSSNMSAENKEWVGKVLSHQSGLPVPYYFDFTPKAREKIIDLYGENFEDVLEYPIRMNGARSIKPLYASPAKYGETIKDEFGVTWTTSEIDRGVPVGAALSEPDLSDYKFPDFSSPYRFEKLNEWCMKNFGNYLIMWVGDMWERATFMRGMENILVDIIVHPKFVEELLEGLANHVLGTMEILFERFDFDGIAFSDDYGTQKSLIMSPGHWRKFVKPHLKRIYGYAKNNGKTVLQHSDGNIYSIIGDLIDIGCDILHPVQPECMDIFALKKEFGKDISFWGGISTQNLLSNASPEEVRKQVRRLKNEIGQGGGYIASNGITIQADVPLENITALIDESICQSYNK